MSEPTDGQKLGAGCGLLLLIAVIAAVGSLFSGGDSDDADVKPVAATTDAAISVCHQSVEKKLKAPSTAEFGGEDSFYVGDAWTVTGWVDAENSFGAPIRNTWSCEATWLEGDNWSVSSTVVD
jgi:hypothetical protein